MGADQTPDPTAWSDDQLDDFLDRLAERAAERDDLDLPGSGASRRSVLTGLLGLGGAAAGAGVASAIGESESYGAASGVVGTDSEPLNEANVQDLHAQDVQVDRLLQVAEATISEETLIESTLNANKTGISAGAYESIVDTEVEDNRGEQDSSFNITVGETGYYRVEASVRIAAGSDQDNADLVVRDVDSNSVVRNGAVFDRLPGGQGGLQLSATVLLSSGTNYQIQARNRQSVFDLISGNNSFYRVFWSPVQNN